MKNKASKLLPIQQIKGKLRLQILKHRTQPMTNNAMHDLHQFEATHAPSQQNKTGGGGGGGGGGENI
jgi:uncharacterized membrane protein